MVCIDIVIPVYNAEQEIESCIDTLLNWIQKYPKYDWKIIIANNASTDETLNKSLQLEKTYPNKVSVINIPLKGRGIAVRTAWTSSKADVYCFMDVDLSTDLNHIPELINPIVDGNMDICYGTRWHKKSKIKRDFFRGILSWNYNFFLKHLLGLKVSDAQCGFKAVNHNTIEKVVPLVKDNNWFFDSELLLIAQENNFRIKEMPIHWTDNSKSTVIVLKSISEFLKGIWRMRVHGIPKIEQKKSLKKS